MKTIYLLFSVCLLSVVIAITSFVNNNTFNHETSFIFKETPTAHTVKISYNPKQADLLKEYLDSCLQPDIIFGNEDKIDKDVTTTDKTNFHIKASKGSFYLTASKESNSKPALEKLMNVCLGIKSVIKPD